MSSEAQKLAEMITRMVWPPKKADKETYGEIVQALTAQIQAAFSESHEKFWAKKVAILLKGMAGLGNRITRMEERVEGLEKQVGENTGTLSDAIHRQ